MITKQDLGLKQKFLFKLSQQTRTLEITGTVKEFKKTLSKEIYPNLLDVVFRNNSGSNVVSLGADGQFAHDVKVVYLTESGATKFDYFSIHILKNKEGI
jgi:hypothetical protein